MNSTSAALMQEPSTTSGDMLSRDRDALEAAIRGACLKIAPLWPLKHFVAVNPFLGFTDRTFAATCATMRRVARADMLMPRSFYRGALQDRTIDDAALAAALARSADYPGRPADLAALKAALQRDATSTASPKAAVATVAEVLDRITSGDRHASRIAFMIDQISRWCAAYFDEGQANWRMPGRGLSPYAAWRSMARHDLNPETMGVRKFRQSIASLPSDPVETIAAVIEALGVPERAVEDYLHRALFDIGGWAAYARYLGWHSDGEGQDVAIMRDLLAIRIAWGYALFSGRDDAAFRHAWAEAMQQAGAVPLDDRPEGDPDLALDLILHDAYELAHRRKLVASLLAHAAAPAEHVPVLRKPVQAAFCIDVRSEIIRRALETVCPQVETIGFAGFFGFPIEYVPIGQSWGGAQCPVLLKPAFIVCEGVTGASDEEETEVLGLRLLRRRAAKAWKAFKASAVSSFSYVETAGLLFAGKIVSDSIGLTRTVTDPALDGLDPDIASRVGPRLDERLVAGRATGFTSDQRVAMAEAVLKAMSMTRDFGRLVLLVGHGSTTVNNPHASGLDCGACGGHTGEANARVAAAILNDARVQGGLRARGIHVPADTWFIAALHDTTTDDIKLFDRERVPSTHRRDLDQLTDWLAQASSLARQERAGMLGLTGPGEQAASDPATIGKRVKERSRDWSQVRPEWGLAGNAAFIAAPRERTRGLGLDGKVFLHSYDHSSDAGHGVLELIMTAPMVVASWINLQYFGSTVNNDVFGSGNKVLHNVVGQLGVLEGNGGDLKVGLPWQSVHDGTRFVHAPLRLNAFIEAPPEAMDAIIERNESLAMLVDNGWVHLHAITDSGRKILQYQGKGTWC